MLHANNRHLGFDTTNALVPPDEIRKGCNAPDCIPSVDHPVFIKPGEVDFLRANDLVVSVTISGETRAYPLPILLRHEVVIDRIQGRAIIVTYCPLCGTSMVFDRIYNGTELTFGVSGLLYKSDLILFDRQTRSLWSQLDARAIAGPMAGTEMKWLPSEHMTWRQWRTRFPKGRVLSTDTGNRTNYATIPGSEFQQSGPVAFPPPTGGKALSRKDWVGGLVIDGKAKAFPLGRFDGEGWIDDRVGGVAIRVRYDALTREFNAVLAGSGEAVPVVQAYWFAWKAFHPDTETWSPAAD